MRRIIVALCLGAAGCNGQGLDSPASPSRTSVASQSSGQVAARGGAELPFSGRFTREGKGKTDCCPPTLTITSRNTGEASHLGRFTAASVEVVDLVADTASGTWTFTAANGDKLFVDTAGLEHHDVPPDQVPNRCTGPVIGPTIGNHATVGARITGGTGRFADATGTFIINIDEVVDLGNDAGCGSGSFEGVLTLHGSAMGQ